MHPKDAAGIANSVDPVQTFTQGLFWVCTDCPDISVRKLRIITIVQCSQIPLQVTFLSLPLTAPIVNGIPCKTVHEPSKKKQQNTHTHTHTHTHTPFKGYYLEITNVYAYIAIVPFLLGVWDRMWNSIVSDDPCLFIYYYILFNTYS